jgi:hypothetical protein
VVWYAGWTEPLSLGLLLVAALLWTRRPLASAVLLGLALASKQYFIFLIPLLFLHQEEGQMRRGLIACGTAALTLIPALVVDAGLFIQATIGNLAGIGFRPDTQSITGLLADFGIEARLPVGVWIGVSSLFAVLIGRRSRTPGDFYLYSALVLGFSFVIGQAFPNYWFLVMGMVAIGTVLKQQESRAREKMAPEMAAI